MRKYLLFSLILLLLLTSCFDKSNKRENDGFTIFGNVEGISDSSLILLKNKNSVLDSSAVIDGKFELKGKVNNPTKCLLIIPSTSDYKIFWVENKKITFNAKGKKFSEAKITGSQVQIEADKLWAKILPFRIQSDSITAILNEEKSNDESNELKAKLKQLQEEEKKAEISFIIENPDAIPSVQTLNVYKTTWGKILSDSLYKILSKKMQLSEEGKSIYRYVQLNKNPKVGEQYIDFGQPDVDGNIVNLSDIKAKVVLLDFWAAWCGPCRYENKELVQTYKQFHPYGFDIFGVSGDNDRDDWLAAIKKDELVWTNVRDKQGLESDPFLIYGINGIPDNFLINDEGKIIARNLRGYDLRKKLKELLH